MTAVLVLLGLVWAVALPSYLVGYWRGYERATEDALETIEQRPILPEVPYDWEDEAWR